jgi:hypothetical protein
LGGRDSGGAPSESLGHGWGAVGKWFCLTYKSPSSGLPEQPFVAKDKAGRLVSRLQPEVDTLLRDGMRKPPLRQRLDKATLEKLYHDQGLTSLQIAKRYGSFTSNVLVLMEKYGISRRSPGSGKRRR